jgi:serine/threonine-protein kinase
MTDLLDQLKTALSDRYTIERELGRGGMATVYLAEDLKHHRQVAIKVLDPELARALGAERFLREIEVTAKLTHPHILTLIDSGEADGFLYYVMPYIEGETLRERMNREGQLPLDDALQITREVAAALSYAHSHDVIHRDIKPENVLLSAGEAVVADFGIARAIAEAGGEHLTETGISIGTPAYMSPEQASGALKLDGRSDVYSLGCVLYEMLAGEPPYTGPTAQAVLAKKLSEATPRVSVIRERVPASVEAAIDQALAKAPADRFTTAAQFTDALYSVGPAVPVETEARPVVSPKRRRLVGGIGAAAVLLVIMVVLVRLVASGPITITTANIRAVTSEPGEEFQPAISSDGREVAYVAGLRVIVRSTIDIVAGETRLADELEGPPLVPTWSPDGAFIRFLTLTDQGPAWKEVGKFGGAIRGYDAPAMRHAWSRDGSRVAFATRDSFFVSPVEGGEPELVAVGVGYPHSLAWSPDGRFIAYVSGNANWIRSLNVAPASVWLITADGGEPVPVVDDDYLNVSPQWLPDSRHLLFVSSRDGPRGIFVVEVGRDGPRGPPRSVLPASDPHSISISAGARRLAFAKYPGKQNIWSVPIPRSGMVSIRDALPVTTGNQVIENHTLSPDGEWIAFNSTLRGRFDVYKQRLEAGAPQLVTEAAGTYAFFPKWSPEGSEIAFAGRGLSIVSADGGTPERAVSGFANTPEWSPDGRSIAYTSPPSSGGPGVLWFVSRDSVGGSWHDPMQVTDTPCRSAQWAPDGASVVCHNERGMWYRVSRDGSVVLRYDAAALGLEGFHSMRFSHDGSRLYFFSYRADVGESAWWMPADGGDPTPIVTLDDSLRMAYPTLTVGPEHLYLTLYELESDIWVMDLEW